MTINDFRTAIESKNQECYTAMLAEDISFFSPVEAEPVIGREIVGQLLGLVFDILQDFRYTEQLDQKDLSVLVFQAKIDDVAVEGVDLIRFNSDGLVQTFTVMIRPMAGLQALAEQVAARLQINTSEP